MEGEFRMSAGLILWFIAVLIFSVAAASLPIGQYLSVALALVLAMLSGRV